MIIDKYHSVSEIVNVKNEIRNDIENIQKVADNGQAIDEMRKVCKAKINKIFSENYAADLCNELDKFKSRDNFLKKIFVHVNADVCTQAIHILSTKFTFAIEQFEIFDTATKIVDKYEEVAKKLSEVESGAKDADRIVTEVFGDKIKTLKSEEMKGFALKIIDKTIKSFEQFNKDIEKAASKMKKQPKEDLEIAKALKQSENYNRIIALETLKIKIEEDEKT